MKKFLFLLLLSVCTANVNAETITFTHTGSGAGTLNEVTFGIGAPLNFTISAVGDTDDIVSIGDVLYINNISASIYIDTLGSFDFTTATRFFVTNSINIVGFSHAGDNGADLFNGPGSFPYWDMTSSIGPISGAAELLQWNMEPVNTTGGVLYFYGSYGSGVESTFSATVAAVPEPSSYALLLAGMGLVGFAASRKKRAN